MMCNCYDLNEYTETNPTRDAFVANFKKLERSIELWAELYICNSCGQHWAVEECAEMNRRSNKALKINDSKNWKSIYTTRNELV